jgi:hypothetical protein
MNELVEAFVPNEPPKVLKPMPVQGDKFMNVLDMSTYLPKNHTRNVHYRDCVRVCLT